MIKYKHTKEKLLKKNTIKKNSNTRPIKKVKKKR